MSPEVPFIPSVDAESCLRVKQATGAFTPAGHYTDLTPFSSVRHSANQSQLPACCSPWNASSQAGARLGALLAPGVSRDDTERQRTTHVVIGVCLFGNMSLTSNRELSPWRQSLSPLSQYARKFAATTFSVTFQLPSCFQHTSNKRITTHNNNYPTCSPVTAEDAT